MVKKTNQNKLGNIVKDYYDGNTHIIIYDDSLPKTTKDKKLLNERLIRLIQSILLNDNK
jgi:hypothetical protein